MTVSEADAPFNPFGVISQHLGYLFHVLILNK